MTKCSYPDVQFKICCSLIDGTQDMLLMVLNYEVIALHTVVSVIAVWRGLVIVCGPDEGKG